MRLSPDENRVIALFRPRSTGELIDSAVAIYRQQPGRIIAVILPVLTCVESLALIGQFNALRALRESFRQGLFFFPVPMWVTAGENVVSVAAWVLEFLIGTATVVGASQAYLCRRIEILSSYRQLLRRGKDILWLTLAWFGIVLIPIFVAVTTILVIDSAIGTLLLVVTVPWTAWAIVSFRLAPSALIVEEARPIEALKRSRALTKGSWWRSFGVIVTAELITWVVNSGLQILILIMTSSRPPSGAGFYGVAAAMTLLPAITVRPFAAIVDLSLYFDLRVRKEALDIEVTAALTNHKRYDLKPRIVEAAWKSPWSPIPDSISERH